MALFRQTGDRNGQADALNGLGETLLATGQLTDAREQHSAALAVAAQIGGRYQQARAHYGLARACDATGDPAEALVHWQEALALYAALGAPEAGQIREHLAALVGNGRH